MDHSLSYLESFVTEVMGLEIHYPNGKVYRRSTARKKQVKNYQYANRGMTLEEDINASNEYYLTNQIAVIHKKPTPVQIVHVDYPHRSQAVIREAYFKIPSTTDYNGVYKGKYIDFEAKETKSETSFPLKTFMTIKLNICTKFFSWRNCICHFPIYKIR